MMFQGKNKKGSSNKITANNDAILFPELNNFSVTEAYNSLRINIMFSVPKETCRKILISSSNASEGKTSTSVNVATSIAMTDSKVLLIDCDFRRPRVHRYFSISNRTGMSNFLSGMCTLKDCIIKTPYENLHVIPTGLIPPNPSELLSCENMRKVMSVFEQSYDYIIIDTPPVNIVSDALCLCSIVDGVILVVKLGETNHPDLKKAISSFEYAKANIIGIVLNDAHYSKKSYKSKYYKKYYGYSERR